MIRRRAHYWCALILVVGCCFSPVPWGEEVHASEESNGEQVQYLGETVVTATRRPTSLENAPAVVDVITAEEIEVLPHRNLAELLANLPGVFLYQPQGEGIVTPTTFSMRGISGTERTLLMMDGQEFNSGWSEMWYFSGIPVEAIERIEVVRGPFSSLYGGNAVAGVIHVITKDGWQQPFTMEAQGSRGSFGRYETRESVQSSFGDRFSFFISHNHTQMENYLLNDDHEDIVSSENRDHCHERLHVNTRLLATDNLKVNLSGGHYMTETGYGIGTQLGVKREMDIDRYYVNLRGDWKATAAAQIFFQVAHSSEDRQYKGETFTQFGRFGPEYEESFNRSGFDRTQVSGGTHYEIFDGNTLTVGTDLEFLQGRKKIVDADSGELLTVRGEDGVSREPDEFNYAFFIQDDWLFLDDQFELVLGLRYDSYEDFGDELSPKGALIWHYRDDGRIKVAGGRAFRAPDLNDRYTPSWTMYPGLTRVCNPDLEPETLVSYEVSFENEFFEDRLTTRVTPFYSDAEDFIVSVYLDDPLTSYGQLYQSQNLGDVEIFGVETEIEGRPLDSLRAFINYQYCETRDQDTHQVLDNHPLHRINLGSEWTDRFLDDFMGVRAAAVWRYVSEQNYEDTNSLPSELDPYSTMDVRLLVDLWEERISLFADIYNLFDVEEHLTDDDNFVQERSFIAGIKFKFAID